MKPRPKSLPEKIRNVRANFNFWMSQRQLNPIAGRTFYQECAEREAMRLADVLSKLEDQQKRQMEAIELARHQGRL